MSLIRLLNCSIIELINSKKMFTETRTLSKEDKLERREHSVELREFSRNIYEEIKRENDDKEIIDEELRVKTDFFKGNDGYTDEKIEEDNRLVNKKKKKFSKEKNKNSNGEIFEKVQACFFYRMLREKYLVVRSSDFDDLNGADGQIIERATGNIICTIDDSSTIDPDNIEEKKKKVLEQNINGGSKIRYGLTFEKKENSDDMELIGKELEGIPLFFLHVSEERLNELLNEMNYDLNGSPSEKEFEIFGELVDMMIEEKEEIVKGIKERSEKKTTENEEVEKELNFCKNVLMKDCEENISEIKEDLEQSDRMGKKRKKSLQESLKISMKKKDDLENRINRLENNINNFFMTEKHKVIALENFDKVDELFEEMKKTADELFEKQKM